MAIRNYEFLLSASDIEPRTIQHVGVQYEHNATEINFVVPQKLCDLLSETANLKDVVFRIDVIDGEGGYHPSESIEPKIKDDGVVLSYSIGYDVASIGGVCRLCVVASRINDENREDMIYCSAMARVEFENVYRNERQSTEFERGLNGIVNEAKGYMIASTEVNDNGELLIYYANGAFVNAGRVNLPDVDDKPTQNSQRPIASGGVYEEFENVKSNINNKFSNAVEGKAYGTKVYIDDISPIEHNLTVRIDDNILPYPYFETSKSDNNGLKWTDNGDGSIIINGFSNTLDVPFYLFKGAFVLPAGDYVFALGEGTYTNIKVCIYGDNGLIGWTENGEDILFSVSNNTTITDIYIYPDGLINFDNVVISPGLHCTDKTELKVEVRGENNFAEYAVNSDGTVEGIKSIYPVMELSVSASGGRVMCEYNRDIGAAINELEELIDNVDGASVDIVNNLISYDSDKALSAYQGRILNEITEKNEYKMSEIFEENSADPENYYPTSEAVKKYVAAKIVDNLEGEDIDKALSANMGKVLNEKSIEAFKTISAISDTKMVTGSVISIPDVIENTYIGIDVQDSVTKVFAVGENLFPMLTGENDEPFVVNENKGTAASEFIRYVELPVTYPAGSYRLGATVTTSNEAETNCMIRLMSGSTMVCGGSLPVNKGEQRDVSLVATAPFNRIALYSGINNNNAKGNSATYKNICLRNNNVLALNYTEYCGKVYNIPVTEIVAHNNPLDIWTDDLSALKVTYCKQKEAFASPNPYYFDNNYLPSKVDTINALVKSTAVNGDSFIFITDQHLELNTTTWLSQNAGQSPALINYINQNTKVNKLFLGGDTFIGSKKDYSELIDKAFSGEIHYSIGNHEYDSGETDASLFYDYDMNKKEQIGNSQRHYYYVDNPQQKMRYVVLNPYITDGSATVTGWDEAQKAWLNNVALNVESGWGIIIIMHYMWSNAWKNDIQSAIDNYSGNGEIIAVFNGHLHHDEIKYTTGGTPCIAVTCDKYDATNDTLMNVERTFGTITEQAFDVVVVDRTARQIHCVRIGAPAVDGDGTDTTNLVEIRVVDFKAKE